MAGGFFDLEEAVIQRGDEAPVIRGASFSGNCGTCGLNKKATTPEFKAGGAGRLSVLFIADAPGKEDDETGRAFSGDSGKLFRELLRGLGYDLEKDFRYTFAVRCYTKDTAGVPVMSCRKKLMAEIAALDPAVIIPMGTASMSAILGERGTGALAGCSLVDWAGERIPDQELKRWVCPTWSPVSILKWNGDEVITRQFKEHIVAALKLIGVPVPDYDMRERVKILRTPEEAAEVLRDIRANHSWASFDYETTGIKPERKGHEIVSASVAAGGVSYAFPFFMDSFSFLQAWKRFLTSPLIEKCAHNAKFERRWTLARLGYRVAPLGWDTMLAAKAMRNQKRISLKFLGYVKFGVAGYEGDVSPYLSAPKTEDNAFGDNGFNMVRKAPLDKLLQYNAEDSLLTEWLREYQQRELPDHCRPGLAFFLNASGHLSTAECNGIRLDAEGAEKARKFVEEQKAEALAALRYDPELKKYWKGNEAFSPSKDAHLRSVLFDGLGYEAKSFTDSGAASVDKESLADYDHDFVRNTLKWKKWDKAGGTYLADFLRETVEGVLRPSFNLHIVDTFRSSSSGPNFQNIPKRDKEVMTLLRQILKPAPGMKLMEYDYKAVEVCISACYNKDPNLIKYVTDPSTDMHRDTGCELFMRTKETLTKAERNVAKNKFVFPEFYGSYFEIVAPDLWKAMPAETREHIRANGIKNLKQYTAFVREIEDKFWGERFAVYAEWKRKTVKDFARKGYVDLYTGFRCYGPMKRNEIVNYPIQGSAFHCLLWTLSRVTEELEREGMKSFFMGQIHDAAVPSVHPEEEAAFDYLMWDWGTRKIREHWPWIIVPLAIEKSGSETDGDWAHMTDYGLLNFEK